MGPQAGLMVPRLTSRHGIPALKAAVRAPENWQAGSLLDARVSVGFLGCSESCGHGGHQGLQSRSFWTKRHCWKEGRKWRGVSLETLWQEGVHSKWQQLTLITATGGGTAPHEKNRQLAAVNRAPSPAQPCLPACSAQNPSPSARSVWSWDSSLLSVGLKILFDSVIGIWLASALPCPPQAAWE